MQNNLRYCIKPNVGARRTPTNNIAVFLFGCLLANSIFAAVSASTDRTQVPDGESLQLTLMSDEPHQSQSPDITVLNQDFDILSKIQSTQISVMNGKQSVNVQWVYVLVPKHTGKIIIPGIAIGRETTQPITISVTPANDLRAPVANRNVFLTTSLNPTSPYVQSQTLYTLKLYYNTQIANPELKEPSSSAAKIFQVGRPSTYTSTVNGRNYQVMEIHFAVIPQSSGNIQLQPAVFTGNMTSQSMQGYYGPTWQPIRVSAPDTPLNVKPIPNNVANDWWLPASKVTLSEQYQPALNTVKAGDPVTRIITITANGTTADNLPKVSPDTLAGASVYLDKPNSDTQTVGDTIVATRIERMVIIPSAAGQLTIPAVSLHWFNTLTNSMNTASLPAHSLTVTANPTINQGHLPPPITSLPTHNTSIAATSPTTPITSSPWQHNRWFWLAMGLILLWIVTLIAWRLTYQSAKQSSTRPEDLPRRQLFAKAQQLAENHDAAAFSHQLLSLAQNLWPDAEIHQLGDIKGYLNDAGKQVIDRLNQQLYYHTPEPWDGIRAWKILKPQLSNKPRAQKSYHHLPDAYPEDKS